MNKTLLAGAMLAFLLAAPPGWAAPPKPQADGDRPVMEEALRLVRAGDQPAAAAAALERVMATNTYRQAPADKQLSIRATYLDARARSGQAKEVYPELKSLTDAGAGGQTIAAGDLWYARMDAAWSLGDLGDCLTSLAFMAQGWPNELTNVGYVFVFSLFGQTYREEALKGRRIDAMIALHDAGWTPQDPFSSMDGLRLEIVTALLERGETDRAKAVAAEITEPGTVAAMGYVRRYGAALTPALAGRDLSQMGEADIQAVRAQIGKTPDRLSGPVRLGRALLSQGRLAEALAVVDDAIGKATAPKPLFNDPDSLRRVYNAKADILLLLGRGDEAIEAMKAGAAQPELGGSNVSQRLDLAQLYAALDRPRDALAAADAVEDQILTPYGRMVREAVRAEARFQLRDEAGLQASLTYLRAHAGDAPLILVETLVDSGQEDEVARYLIKLLDDPFRQVEALAELQVRVVPASAPEFLKRRQRTMKALGERADVEAAVDAVGRIEALPFTVGL